MKWKVVPLSEGQLTDVRPEDVLDGGLYRKCETYRGGGGYDQFPIIAERRFGKSHHLQFIVQLRGCNLDCPYCYVTREGVWGEPTKVPTEDLVTAFIRAHDEHQVSVFHLMGGAPALQIKHWPELLSELSARCDFEWVFHSDMMLTEAPYDPDALAAIASSDHALIAVDVKGLTDAEHLRNTRKPWRPELFWSNLDALEAAGVPYYLTFTAVENERPFWDEYQRRWPRLYDERYENAFSIDLIEYNAQPFVDRVAWGATK